ncbi:protein SON isoform X1 [Acyrthosiphon pisum]|uniref:Protein SON n=1 Tax=Acyrthosiphon pisum TaxID=7029 RepID=A0A8R2A8Q2_ACYPI|nr:protein SON isoform X1 [Acyrthosiphon pisum]|eukprot:XP_001952647.1 PREDICTED: protein SON isoform X1 [Acyrthosiphon pisum]
MEKTSDTIIKELFNSLEQKVPYVPESDVKSTKSMVDSIKKHKRHDKSKKHKKHKKKSKKSKKKKRHTRSNSLDDYIVLKLKKDKLEEAKSGMSVSLDMIMETIVNTANEKSEAVKDVKHDENENCHIDTTLIDEIKVNTPENDSNQTKLNTTGLNNGKIIIKDLKESRLYHELVNEVQEKERLKTEKCKNSDQSNLSQLEIKKKKEKHKSKKKKRSRSRNRSRTPKRLKKYSRSRSNSSKDRYSRHNDFKSRQTNSKNQSDSNTKCKNNDSDIKLKEKSNHHKRSITPDKKLIRRSRSRDSKKLKRSEDYSRTRKQSRSRETSRSRHTSPSCEKIDKKKLFKIARKNALSLVQQGVLPVGSVKKDNLANVPTKTVDELTDFCRKLSKKDKDHDDDSSYSSDDDEFKQPFHHPFLVKERPNIVMNIRNATQLPIKSFQEKTIGQDILRQQFPVSSGQTHSLALTEWVPIGPEESAKLNKILKPDEGNKLPNKPHHSYQAPKVAVVEPVIQPVSSPNNAIVPMDYQYVSPTVEIPAFTPYTHSSYSLLSFETGQFTGHTGAKVLTPAELSAGFQTWVKKDQLKNSAPVNSGIGIHLLQKMGWKPGEGLGKNQSGSLEPLLLDVKMDKRGLVAEEELQGSRIKRFSKKATLPVLSLEGKHPVSLLNEFCAKRKWDIPKFNTLDESGPSHRKTFIMTVVVNGVQYCSSRCQTKKLAKMEAAKECLKEIGLLNTTNK